MPDHASCTETFSYPNDDGTVSLSYAWAYDERERLDSQVYTDPDADYLESWTWAYDDDDCVLETVYDYAFGPTKHEETAYTCAGGYPTHAEMRGHYVWNEESATDEERITDYTWDLVDGLPVLEVEVQATDDGDTGVIRRSYDWVDGLLVREDGYGGESWSTHEEWRYDDDGNVVAAYDDDDGWLFYEYDAHGRLVRATAASDEAATEILGVETWTWRDDIYAATTVAYDDHGDGPGYGDWETTADCSDTWPWTCEGDRELYGEATASHFVDSWSCGEAE